MSKMKWKIHVKLNKRPIFSLYMSVKYSIISILWGINDADWHELMKLIGREDDPNYRLENVLEKEEIVE